ncbi:MAG TPA: ABC transporter ATP-binding protein [Terriglobia bacterium]|nr:ABC transporter ATP-binding protein [Terriglobia bacterium]
MIRNQGTSGEVLVRAEGLTRIFCSGGDKVVVFEDLNFQIHAGEFVALVGESGAGKSTLLQLLAALDTPSSGEVYFVGEKISRFSEVERAHYRRAKLGFVWQMHYLLPEFSALENVMMPGLVAGMNPGAAKGKALELLVEVGLSAAANRRPGELSGGERQRVALARALINQPALLLADEPTGNLDYRSAERISGLLKKLHQEYRLTSVLATHNMEIAQRADRMFHLASGKLTETAIPRAQ